LMKSLVTTRREGGVLVWSRVIESDRDVTCSDHFGGTGKNILTGGKEKSKLAKEKSKLVLTWIFLLLPPKCS
jgi:hypothetical protein